MLKKIQHGNKKISILNFYLLVIGIFISRIGTGIYNIALTTWLTYKTLDTELTGYIMTTSTIGVLLSTPFAGWIVDIANKKHIMIVSDFICGLVSFIISLFCYYEKINLPSLIICSFLLSFSSTLFKPASKSVMPQIMQASELLKANATITALSESASILAPLLTTFIFFNTKNGPFIAFLLNALSYWVSVLLEALIQYNEITCSKKKSTIITSFIECIKYLKREKKLLYLIVYSAIINFFCSGFSIIFPLYTNVVLNLSDYDYSYLLTFKAWGALFISLFFIFHSSSNIKKLSSLYIAIFFYGSSLLFMNFFYEKSVFLLGLFIMGSSVSFFNIKFFSYIQSSIKHDMLGKILSIVYIMALITSPFAYMFFGQNSKFFLRNSLYILGIGTIITTLFFCFLLSAYRKPSKNQGF